MIVYFADISAVPGLHDVPQEASSRGRLTGTRKESNINFCCRYKSSQEGLIYFYFEVEIFFEELDMLPCTVLHLQAEAVPIPKNGSSLDWHGL